MNHHTLMTPNVQKETTMNPHQSKANKTIGSSLTRWAASTVLVIGAGIASVFVTSLALCSAASAGIITTDPSLPPNQGGYFLLTPPVKYILPGPLVIDLFDIFHFGFTNIIRIPAGADELEFFDSTVTGNVSINGGPKSPVMLTGSVETEVFGKTGNTTGSFQTEMLQLNLTGGGIMVRESPTLQSLGQTTITDLGGGSFKIDSFFDIFTELSMDGGQTWTPATGLERVELVHEPGSLVLLVAGLALLGWRKRHWETPYEKNIR
jgi:hypothetical protein